jgi:hypothetical protein
MQYGNLRQGQLKEITPGFAAAPARRRRLIDDAELAGSVGFNCVQVLLLCVFVQVGFS